MQFLFSALVEDVQPYGNMMNASSWLPLSKKKNDELDGFVKELKVGG